MLQDEWFVVDVGLPFAYIFGTSLDQLVIFLLHALLLINMLVKNFLNSGCSLLNDIDVTKRFVTRFSG